MGKYMKKSKTAGDVAVTKVSSSSSSSSSIGVRTRSKTLALQNSSAAFLQLRTRRLHKVLVAPPSTNHSHLCSCQNTLDSHSQVNSY
ncbi:Cyclin-dependent kinase inhibitor 3, partial [Mucuna pruriens]